MFQSETTLKVVQLIVDLARREIHLGRVVSPSPDLGSCLPRDPPFLMNSCLVAFVVVVGITAVKNLRVFGVFKKKGSVRASQVDS